MCYFGIKKGPKQFALNSLDRYISSCSNQQSSKLSTYKLYFPSPFVFFIFQNEANSNLMSPPAVSYFVPMYILSKIDFQAPSSKRNIPTAFM